MKCNILRLFLVLFLIMFGVSSCFTSGKSLNKIKFDKVVDGDTIKVLIDGKPKDVKLIFVDAPNLRGSHPFSFESKKFLEKKLLNTSDVYLEFDEKRKNIDEHNDINAYVWYYNDEGKLELLNNSVLFEGFGRILNIPEGSKYRDELISSEKEAREKNKNIWSIDGYVTENGYNKINIEG